MGEEEETFALSPGANAGSVAYTVQAGIASWFERACFGERGFGADGGGVMLRIKEFHSGRYDLVNQYHVKRDMPSLALAQQIYLDAAEEADGSGGGVHNFQLTAHHQGQKEHFSRKSFPISVEMTGDAPVEEETTAKGLLSQAYRHLEATQRINATALPALVHGYASVTAALADRVAQNDRNIGEVMALWRDMVVAKDEREAETILRIQKNNRVDRAVEATLKYALPLILPKILAMISPTDVQNVMTAIQSLANNAQNGETAMTPTTPVNGAGHS